MRRTCVKVDFRKLAWRLWQSHGQWFTDYDLRQWMQDAGCLPDGGTWYACTSTDHLNADEIVEVITRETVDEVTYVSRHRRDPQRL